MPVWRTISTSSLIIMIRQPRSRFRNLRLNMSLQLLADKTGCLLAELNEWAIYSGLVLNRIRFVLSGFPCLQLKLSWRVNNADVYDNGASDSNGRCFCRGSFQPCIRLIWSSARIINNPCQRIILLGLVVAFGEFMLVNWTGSATKWPTQPWKFATLWLKS